MEQKFLAGLAWSLMAMVLPRSDSRLVMAAALEPRSRMQPPCTPEVIRTSNPCSKGLSQRNAIPMPASALPVAIASSNCSVEPPKLINSTSRLCFAKTPRSFATGAADEQIEVAFHAIVSARAGPDSPSQVIAARQRGNSSGRGQPFIAVIARAAPSIATGVATPTTPARPRIVRRERQDRVGLRTSVVKPVLFSLFSMATSLVVHFQRHRIFYAHRSTERSRRNA